MSISSAIPVVPMRGSSAKNVPLTHSPSDDLAITLAGIRLDDGVDEDDADGGADESLASTLELVESKITAIREQFFTIQEKRHAGVFALVDKTSASPGREESAVTEHGVALDMAMAQLNALFEAVSDGLRIAEGQLTASSGKDIRDVAGISPRRRTASVASMSSLDSFDDAFNGLRDRDSKTSSLRKRFDELTEHWIAVQSEGKTLEEELSGDKYLLVFTSICEQMEGMMGSLERALTSCHEFVFAFHKDRAERVFPATNSPSSYSSSQWSSAEDRLKELKMVKRSFDVKKSSYGPACEHMFVSMQKGVKQQSTQNGTILRKYSEMKTRWRGLRERVSKMDKELRQIEVELIAREEGASTESRSPKEQMLSPNRVMLRPKSRLRGKNDSATNTPTHMSRSISIGDLQGESKALSPSNLNTGLLLFPSDASPASCSPPIKPPKSMYRRSMVMQGKPDSSNHHARSISSTAALVPPIPNVRSSSRPAPPSASNRLSRDPIASPARSAGGERHSSVSRYARAGSEPPVQSDNVFQAGSTTEQSIAMAGLEADESLLDLGDASFASIETAYRRPASVAGLYDRAANPSDSPHRPPSAAGSYYRPPSAAGSYYRPPNSASDTEGPSRIPRLATGQTPRRHNASDRPGSAMSYASSTAYGTSPSVKTFYARGQHPPSSFHNHERVNRLSMQTPEPTIAARAQRMNMFAPKATNVPNLPSKRSSRPPPAKYNASVYGGAGGGAAVSNLGGSSYSHSGSASAPSTSPSPYRTLATTKPLNISKRSSAVWSANGRTTPLSAAALAKLPQETPGLGEHGHRNVSGGSASASVANFRGSQRAAMANSEYGGVASYSASVMSGRETPTFSEGGDSSVWGGGTRRAAAAYAYRPNPNDAIDVEVANIVNSLGMAIERVDPPLPRGVKEMNPSSTKTVKYEVGGKIIVCKLLQLHRPASLRSVDDKTNKVLTRVGGGWIDLRQYLLSRLGTS